MKWPRILLVGSLFSALIMLVGLPAAAQESASDTEWERGEGYHEEEWYDPTDWFDGDQDGVSYETDDYWDDDYEYYSDDDEYYMDDDGYYTDGGYQTYTVDDEADLWDDEPEWSEEDYYAWYDPTDWAITEDSYYTSDWHEDDSDFDAWYE